MPDDESDERWTNAEPEPEGPGAAHDDIMKRLVNYQRSLREGASPEEAAAAVGRGSVERYPAGEPSTVMGELVDVAADAEPEVAIAPEPEQEAHPEANVEAEPAPQAAATEAEVQAEEPEPEPAASSATAIGETRSDLEARLASLEDKLDRLGSKIGEVRQGFQEMAIAADERLAALEEELDEARRGHENE
ncbi:MAG: hypothetical protein ACXWX6_08240 [Actinomycetota bacterium]